MEENMMLQFVLRENKYSVKLNITKNCIPGYDSEPNARKIRLLMKKRIYMASILNSLVNNCIYARDNQTLIFTSIGKCPAFARLKHL